MIETDKERGVSKLKTFLLHRPVLIASHASPAFRGRVGQVVKLEHAGAVVRLSGSPHPQEITVPFQGLRLIRKSTVAPAPAPRRSRLASLISIATRAAFSRNAAT